MNNQIIRIAIATIIFLYPAYSCLAQGAGGLPPKRAHHELVYDESSRTILLTGGSTPLNGGESFAFFNDLWRFDGKTWTQSGVAGDQRSGIRMAYDTKRNKLFSYGGFANNQSLPELRVLENGEWRILSRDSNMKAAEAGFVYDSHLDRFIAFGGTGARGTDNNITWEWKDSVWKKIEGKGPEGRSGFAMIYDSKRKRVVLYGGAGGPSREKFTETWELDGSQWNKISIPGPGPRISSGFTYDEKRGLMILFGGMGAGGFLNDTWSWDGKQWTKLADTGPAKRAMGYIVYDKSRDRVVLFGGRLGWPNDTNDTWEWDGTEWREIK